MREIRLSGSVEGVMGNHDSYSDFRMTLLAIEAKGGRWEVRSTKRIGESKMLADRILHPCAANARSRENQRLKWAEYRNAGAASASSKIGLPVVRDCGGWFRRWL
jgi:hypothetical protein